jgi:hypothetical protein
MNHSLPSAIAHRFEEMAASHRHPWRELPPGRLQQAAAIHEWAWWLSRQLPPGLESLVLYHAGRLSLTLHASGKLRVIHSQATSMLGGAIVAGPHDLERVLHGGHLDALSESILGGGIWTRIQQSLAG